MEKVIFENNCGNKLTGIIRRTEKAYPARFVVMVHGFTGNKDEKGLFVEAEKSLLNKGFSIFRFDLRGCGESEGNLVDFGIEDQKDDLLTGIYFLKNKENLDFKNIYIIGFSLGATISIMAYKNCPMIKALAFWSPAFFPNRDMFPRYQTEEILNDLSHKGFFIKSGIKVGKKIIEDLRDCNIVPLIQSIKTPVLVIHGDNDNKISIKSSEIVCNLLNGNTHFRKIFEADHSFRKPSTAKQTVFDATSEFFLTIANSVNY